MDDVDVYGIPSDSYYYSEETPQHYSENVPTSSFQSFDELLDETLPDNSYEDFGEYMRVTLVSLDLCQTNLHATIGPHNLSPGLTFGDPSEPRMELFNAGAPGHRGLGSIHSELLSHPFPPELGQPAARRDQSFQCMYSNVRRFLLTDRFIKFASRGVVARCKMYSQATFRHTGHSARILCNVAHRITTPCENGIAVSEKETLAIRRSHQNLVNP